MKRRLPIILGVVVLLVLVAALLNNRIKPRYNWGTCPRFKFDPVSQLNEERGYSWALHCAQVSSVSNHFGSAVVARSISVRTGVNVNEFSFSKARPVRNTSLIELHFYASTSNDVWLVGQAATEEMSLFYQTNQSGVTIKLIDPALANRRRPMWQEALDWVSDLTPW